MFSLDLSEKIRPPEEEVVSLVQMVHEVVGSKIFKDTRTLTFASMGVAGRTSLGEMAPQKHTPSGKSNCDLDVVNPSPLDTTLMDKEILVAMAYLTSGGVPPHDEWAADPLLSKVAYNEGQVPAGVFKHQED